MMGETHQMFMLFFSILYGIMLNSVIGLGAFPVGEALALRDLVEIRNGEKKWVKGFKSSKRLVLSVVILNLSPLLYFALIYYPIGDILSSNLYSWTQIFCLGLLSLSVFGFYRFYLGAITWKSCGNLLFYTEEEARKHTAQRDIDPSPWAHIFAGFGYLVLPWAVTALFKGTGLLPI
jgi:hypothetical protein